MTSTIKLLINKDKLLFSQMSGYMIMYAVMGVAIISMIGWFTPYPIILTSIFFSTAVCSSVVHEEEQSKCNLTIFTLPVKITDYLKARYTYFAFYPIKMVFITSIIGMAINLMTVPSVRNVTLLLRYANGFIIAMSVALVFPAIFVPLYYAFGTMKSRVVFMMLAFFTTIFLNSFILSDNSAITLNSFITPVILLVISIIAYYISYRISIKVARGSRVF